MSFSGKTTMERGKYINVSFRFIGMEVASFHINNDSVFFVDKYHKYYFAEPLEALKGTKYRNVTLNDIQDILLGWQKVPENDKVSILTSDYVPTEVGDVASTVDIDADTPHGLIKAEIEWKPTSAKWNKLDKSVTFKLPDKYRRITVDNLTSMLKSMSF